jgi:hypothetical protein
MATSKYITVAIKVETTTTTTTTTTTKNTTSTHSNIHNKALDLYTYNDYSVLTQITFETVRIFTSRKQIIQLYYNLQEKLIVD